MQSAWSRDPRLRPSFYKIERDLRSLRQKNGAAPDSPRPPSMAMLIEEEDNTLSRGPKTLPYFRNGRYRYPMVECEVVLVQYAQGTS